MLIKQAETIRSSEITPEQTYLKRRDFITGSLSLCALAASGGLLSASTLAAAPAGPAWAQGKFPPAPNTTYDTNEKKTPFDDVIRYNNFYEFGTDKDDPEKNAQQFKTDPWTVEVTGAVNKPGKYALEDLIKPHQLEERIYRLRCVEAWSMVIPWVGIPMADVIKRFEPTSAAKYVEMETLFDPEQMPGQKSGFSRIDWPYREGLRIDEAMHPLTLLAVGLYGQVMPPQNGAPIRLVVPWKYGFKSIKSIVKLHFRETQPPTTWNLLAPEEYGFYANVNPNVDHPRWSQKSERRLPSSFFSPNRIETQMFNGYANEVAHLYSQLDLTRNY